MVKHIVTFKLRGTVEERREAAEKFREALLKLPDIIDCLQSMEVGVNENPGEDWDIVLTAVVPTLKDVEVYSKHPAHIEAAAIITPVKENRACVDYSI